MGRSPISTSADADCAEGGSGLVGVEADASDEAVRFVGYLISPAGQEYFATRTWEYPTVPDSGVDPVEGLIGIERFRGPEIDLSDLGAQLPETLNLLAEVGML